MSHKGIGDIQLDMTAQHEKAKARLRQAEETYDAHLKRLLPIAFDALPTVFGHYAKDSSAAAAVLADARNELSRAQEAETQRLREFEDARRNFGEIAETERRRMISTPEYEEAAKGVAAVESNLKVVDMQLQALEATYVRAARSARQNPLMRLLVSDLRPQVSTGFLAGAVLLAFGRVRQTEWFGRVDSERRKAEADLAEKREVKQALTSSLNKHLSTIGSLRQTFDSTIAPRRAELSEVEANYGEAVKLRSKAQERLARAEETVEDIRLMRDPAMKAALIALEAIFDMDASAETLVHCPTLRKHPGAEAIITDLSSAAEDRESARQAVIALETKIARKPAHSTGQKTGDETGCPKELSGIFEAAAATSLVSAMTIMAIAEAADNAEEDGTSWQDSNPFCSTP